MEEGAAMDKKQTPAMLLKIKSMRENLSKAELLVCDYIIEHPEEVIYLSVSELAAAIHIKYCIKLRPRAA